jgi:heme exporter protein D
MSSIITGFFMGIGAMAAFVALVLAIILIAFVCGLAGIIHDSVKAHISLHEVVKRRNSEALARKAVKQAEGGLK